MSSERDELLRLVREMPDEDVAVLLEVARRRLKPVGPPRPWPPAFFGIAGGDGSVSGASSEAQLADGFAGGGRPR